MRAPGMNLGGNGRFMDILSAGPDQTQPVFDGVVIGTSWHTPEQASWKASRGKYGSLDDPDAGGYQLNQINWDKEGCEMTTLEATNGGWYTPSPSVKCNCPPVGVCGCI